MRPPDSRSPFRSVSRRAAPSAHQGTSGDIDVWRAGLDQAESGTLARWQSLMSADEAERARRFHFERDRRRFVVARGILRTLLGDYLARAPQELQFEYGANGKPMLARAQAGSPALQFNLAHAGDLALFAFTRDGDVGIDLERVRAMPDWARIAAATFGPVEISRLRAAAPERRDEEFFAAWVRQEALLKALGIGLGGRDRTPEPTMVASRGECDDPRRERSDLPATRADERACLAAPLFRPAPGFIAALAARPAERWVNCLSWVEATAEKPLHRRGRRVRLESISNHEDLFA